MMIIKRGAQKTTTSRQMRNKKEAHADLRSRRREFELFKAVSCVYQAKEKLLCRFFVCRCTLIRHII